MSEQTIAVKAEKVEVVADKFKNAASSIVVDLRGLTVAENTDLRNKLREEGVELEVVKNNILRRAVEKADVSGLEDLFVGPSAIAFSHEDAIAPTRILKEFSDAVEALEIKGGVVDGKVASLEDINRFATLPSREGLLGQLMAEFQYPVRSFMYAVKAIAEKREAEEGSTPAAEETPAPAPEAEAAAPVEESIEAAAPAAEAETPAEDSAAPTEAEPASDAE